MARMAEHRTLPNGEATSVKIKNLENDSARIDRNVDELFRKNDATNSNYWKVLGAVVALLIAAASGFGGSLLSPINADIGELKRDVRESRKTDAAHGALLSTHAALIEQNTKTVDTFRGLIRRLEDGKVDEKVYAKDWQVHLSANGRELSTLQRQIDDSNKKLDSIAPPRDWFQDLMRRLAALEQQRPLKLSVP